MNFTGTLLIAIGLAMDCFAVSLCVGTSQKAHQLRFIFRLSFHFGLFQGGMTLLGWLAGSSIVHYISNIDHWVAFGLLAFIGLRMIIEGLDKRGTMDKIVDPSRGSSLILLSLATSIDALAIGLSLALLHANIIYSGLIIGMVSLCLTIVGLIIGQRLGSRFGKRMEILGGLILIGIGFNILFSHLASG